MYWNYFRMTSKFTKVRNNYFGNMKNIKMEEG